MCVCACACARAHLRVRCVCARARLRGICVFVCVCTLRYTRRSPPTHPHPLHFRSSEADSTPQSGPPPTLGHASEEACSGGGGGGGGEDDAAAERCERCKRAARPPGPAPAAAPPVRGPDHSWRMPWCPLQVWRLPQGPHLVLSLPWRFPLPFPLADALVPPLQVWRSVPRTRAWSSLSTGNPPNGGWPPPWCPSPLSVALQPPQDVWGCCKASSSDGGGRGGSAGHATSVCLCNKVQGLMRNKLQGLTHASDTPQGGLGLRTAQTLPNVLPLPHDRACASEAREARACKTWSTSPDRCDAHGGRRRSRPKP